MAFIKNIEHEEIVRLADEISANTGQVVSKTLAQNSCVSITLFAFAKERRSEHTILQATRWSQSSKEKADSWWTAGNTACPQGKHW